MPGGLESNTESMSRDEVSNSRAWGWGGGSRSHGMAYKIMDDRLRWGSYRVIGERFKSVEIDCVMESNRNRSAIEIGIDCVMESDRNRSAIEIGIDSVMESDRNRPAIEIGK